MNELPACYFPTNVEKTYDRSIRKFIEAYQGKRWFPPDMTFMTFLQQGCMELSFKFPRRLVFIADPAKFIIRPQYHTWANYGAYVYQPRFCELSYWSLSQA